MRKNKQIAAFVVVLIVLTASKSHSQESINASGGNAVGVGGKCSYSIGQVAFHSITENAGITSEGVQHAFEIYSIEVKEYNPAFELIAFPNPTNENIILATKLLTSDALTYELLDAQSKLIVMGSIRQNSTPLQMSGLPSATYFLQVKNREGKKVHSFKIIKN